MNLLTPGSFQTKLRKSETEEFAVYSLSLAPADYAGRKTVCPHSTADCRLACVGGPGSGLANTFPSIMQSRTQKTLFFFDDREQFLIQLTKEIRAAEHRERKNNKTPVIRLNAFSDLTWERFPIPGESGKNVFDCNPDCIFYDYTKILARGKTQLPENYYLCFSYSGTNAPGCLDLLHLGQNVSVVFAQRGEGFTGSGAMNQRIPARYRLPGSDHLWTVEDGDQTDLRHTDKRQTRSGVGRIIGLRLKTGTILQRAQLMDSTSGFVQIID